MKDVKLFFLHFAKIVKNKIKNRSKMNQIIDRVITTTGKNQLNRAMSISNLFLISFILSISGVVVYYNKKRIKDSVLSYFESFGPKEIKKKK
jgi:Ni,Fe-hydrogenase I cytochrome b subunit